MLHVGVTQCILHIGQNSSLIVMPSKLVCCAVSVYLFKVVAMETLQLVYLLLCVVIVTEGQQGE